MDADNDNGKDSGASGKARAVYNRLIMLCHTPNKNEQYIYATSFKSSGLTSIDLKDLVLNSKERKKKRRLSVYADVRYFQILAKVEKGTYDLIVACMEYVLGRLIVSWLLECTEAEVSKAVRKLNQFFSGTLKKVLSTEEAAATVVKEFRSHVQHGVPFCGKNEKVVVPRSRVCREAIDVTASEAEGPVATAPIENVEVI